MPRASQIARFLRPYWRPLAWAIGLTGALTLIGMVPPLVMRRLINDVAKGGRWDIFYLLAAILIAVPLLRAAASIANGIALNRVGQGIIGETRRRIFARLMELSLRFYDEMPAGGISQRLMGDVATISTVATGGLVMLVTDAIAVAFAVSVMVGLSAHLSLLMLVLLPLYLGNYWFFSRRIRTSAAVLRTNMDHISASLQERLSAHELIQTYGQEKADATHFSSQAKQVMDAAIRGAAYNISFNQMAAFINKLANSGIYAAGCYLFIKGELGYGDVVAFCAYATQIIGPAVRIGQVANQISQVGVSIDRIQQILDREPLIRDAGDAEPVQDMAGDIHVRGVEFQYGGRPALRGVDLEIPAGTHLALAGPVGSGRTTLAMLLRRFFDPDEGDIEVDGRNLRGLRVRDYRRRVGLIQRESAIFDGTIRENLCYGKPDADEATMVDVARAVGLHDFVERLVHNYDTRVGAGGLKLSSGVVQQIGVARALIAEPLVLIADQATNAMDPVLADRTLEAIQRAMEGRTAVLIVNRLHLARRADRVVVMRDGQLVEDGTHDDLLEAEGSFYRELYRRQYGEEASP